MFLTSHRDSCPYHLSVTVALSVTSVKLSLEVETWQLSLAPRRGSSPDSRLSGWGQGGAHVRQGDENTSPYDLITLCPLSDLLLSVPFSPCLSHLVPWSKNFLTGDLGKGTYESKVELLVVSFYHRGKSFPNCERISLVVGNWPIQENCAVFYHRVVSNIRISSFPSDRKWPIRCNLSVPDSDPPPWNPLGWRSVMYYCCLLLIDKTRGRDKTCIWVSVRWKTKN